jgi:hypothetical protein
MATEFYVTIEDLTWQDQQGVSAPYTASDSKFLSPDSDRIINISGIKETFDARPTEVTIEISGLNKTTQLVELFDENTDSRYQRQITVSSRNVTEGVESSTTLLFEGIITRTSLTRSSKTSTINISASNYNVYAENIVATQRASDFGYSSSPDIVYWGYLEIQEE